MSRIMCAIVSDKDSQSTMLLSLWTPQLSNIRLSSKTIVLESGVCYFGGQSLMTGERGGTIQLIEASTHAGCCAYSTFGAISFSRREGFEFTTV